MQASRLHYGKNAGGPPALWERDFVARFFKYRSIDDLLAENGRLGIGLRFSDDLSPLWQTAVIGGRAVGKPLDGPGRRSQSLACGRGAGL